VFVDTQGAVRIQLELYQS